MDPRTALDITQQGFQVALMVSLPLMAVTLFVGLIISVFQAVTQVHEMTLTFVPKMISAGVLIAFLGHWMLQQLVAYTQMCFDLAGRVAQ